MERYTVTTITYALKDLLSDNFADVVVEGEITDFKPHSSGHWYFAIKDEGAVIGATMFKTSTLKVATLPRNGDRVFLRGKIEIYPPSGRYSIIAWALKPVGAGDMARKLQELKEKLSKEGLFDVKRKRPLPNWPVAIGVATSATGAALQDIYKVISQRYPIAPIYLANCRVQGEGAAEEIVRAIQLLNQHGKSSVLIVGRGGGSAEDLWVFNDERVVRAVVASRIPIISAVGHEVDFTLIDSAADERGATPSHAAEKVTPARTELKHRLDRCQAQIKLATEMRLLRLKERLKNLELRLKHPRERVEMARLHADALTDRLYAALDRIKLARRERLARVRLPDLHLRIRTGRERSDRLSQRLSNAMTQLHQKRRERWEYLAGQLHALSPLAVLSRGYALVEKDGRPVQSTRLLSVGDALNVKLSDGQILVRVEDISVSPANN